MTVALSPAGFDWVCRLVRRESAIVLVPGKEYLVEARLLPLARELGVDGVSGLVDRLRSRPDADTNRRIVEALTTNETSWFRDRHPFTMLTDTVLPALLAARPADAELRLWSAGCSSGQEAYTIAMLLADALPDAGQRVRITATDLSREMVARTRAGRFSQLEVNRGLPAPLLARHFTRVGTEWQISPALRRMVTASELNLADPLPRMGPFDVVYLRNVLIYFDPGTKREVLRRVRRAMHPDGWLVLGAAESTLGVDDTWERVVDGRGSAYRPTRGT